MFPFQIKSKPKDNSKRQEGRIPPTPPENFFKAKNCPFSRQKIERMRDYSFGVSLQTILLPGGCTPPEPFEEI
jgi:hypothetical protein